MASQLLRIQMAGGGPYGFRLLGGDKSPLTVAKIRPSSKAQVAGLIEGDVILAINNICSQGLSHAAATALMEGNSAALTVHALRGRNALSEVDSTVTSLGPEIRRLTASEASAIVQNSAATSSNDPAMNGAQLEAQFRLQAPPSGGSLKQMRIARRESRESDIQTAYDDAVDQSSQNSPGYYAREERTSSDGGKTTRIVEEVKTEKFGGTTLTKVTKQEFSSYKNFSADPRVDPFPPEISVIRSEEHGYPVPLGAPSVGGNQLRDERGWMTKTSVQKSSVRTEPYEVRIDTTQEPTRTYVVYQDRSKNSLEEPKVSQVQQPIPSIEIQFHPDESSFGIEAKPPRVGANSNFEIRVGKEVTFQPKIQISNEAIHSQSEFHPALKVHEPSFQSQRGTYTKFSHESNQTDYGNQPQLNYSYEPKSNYLEKQTPGPKAHFGNRNESQYRADSHPDYGHTYDSHPGSRPQFGFSEEPDYPYKLRSDHRSEHATKPDRDTHIYRSSDEPQFGYNSDPPPGTQSHCGYYSEPQPITDPKFGYNPELESGTRPQDWYNQEPQPQTNSQLGYNPEPMPITQSQHGYNQNLQPKLQSQHGYNQELKPRIQSQHGYNQDPQLRVLSQHGYNEKPRTHPQVGYNLEAQPNVHPQFGYSPESAYPSKPSSRLQYDYNPEPSQPQNSKPDSHPYRDYMPEPGHVKNPQFGYYAQSEPQYQPTQPDYNPELQYKLGGRPYEPEPPPDEYSNYPTRAAPAALTRQMEPQFHDAASVVQAASSSWGQKFSHGPEGNVTPGNYHPPEAVYGATPFANEKGPIIPRQMDRVERVEIATAPKWMPGSKLPTKQPLKPLTTYSSNPPLTGDPRGLQAENPVAGGYYDQSPEGGWHEPPVAGVKNYPNVALSHVYDPTKQSTETEQSFEYGSAPRPIHEYGAADYHTPFAQVEEEALSGQWSVLGGQSNPSATGRLPGQANVWKPPGFGPASQAGAEEMDDRSRGYSAASADLPPPPAPPLVPMMAGSVHPPPSGYPPMLTPLAPPPPVAPPIDHLKIYRGNSSSDRGYGYTSLEERVKMAKSVAHSVLAPENQNSRGQKMFLRRRENSHKWTLQGPDPVAEISAIEESNRTNPNVWAPKSPGTTQSRPPLLPSALAPQPLVRPTFDVRSDFIDRPQEAPSGGSSTPYSIAEDMSLNNGKGGRLFAERRSKADKWASAESTGRQVASQNIRYGAPQSQAGYGAPAGAPSLGYDSSQSTGRVEGGMAEDYPVTNRLKDLIKPKNPTILWNQQTAQSGQSRGSSTFSAGLNQNVGNRAIRFQGTPVISSSPVAPPAAQPQNFMQAPRFTPKHFGNRAIVGQAVGYTDL